MIPFFPELTGTDIAKDEAISEIQMDILEDANTQLFDRISALAVHYKVEPNNINPSNEVVLFHLIRRLGQDFLPGFQINKGPRTTRPTMSHTVGGIELFDAVYKRVSEKQETIATACEFLNRHGTKKFKNKGASNLETAYHRYKAELKTAHDFLHNTWPYSELIRTIGFEELHSQVEKRLAKTK